MTKKDDENYRNNNICRTCQKNIEYDKVRDHCHLTGDYRGLSHNNCNNNVTQDQSKFIPFMFHIFGSHFHIVIRSSKSWWIKRMIKQKFEIISKTNEEYLSATSGCIRSADTCRFLPSSLD